MVARLCEDPRASMGTQREFEDSVDADHMVSNGGAVVDLGLDEKEDGKATRIALLGLGSGCGRAR